MHIPVPQRIALSQALSRILAAVPPQDADGLRTEISLLRFALPGGDGRSERSRQARERQMATAKFKRDVEIFWLTESYTRHRFEVVGWSTVAAVLGVTERKLRGYLPNKGSRVLFYDARLSPAAINIHRTGKLDRMPEQRSVEDIRAHFIGMLPNTTDEELQRGQTFTPTFPLEVAS